MKKHTLKIEQPLNQGPINRGLLCRARERYTKTTPTSISHETPTIGEVCARNRCMRSLLRLQRRKHDRVNTIVSDIAI